MSVPPQIIQVKRKRNDDGPITFLRIEQNTKRHRSGAFLYRRHDPELALGNPAAAQPPRRDLIQPPVIHDSRPGEENLPLRALARAHATATSVETPSSCPSKKPVSTPHDAISVRAALPSATSATLPSSGPCVNTPATPRSPPAVVKSAVEPRRFHLSRHNSYSSELGSVRGSRVTKPSHASSRSATPALFVERSIKRNVAGTEKTGLLVASPPPASKPASAASELQSPQLSSPLEETSGSFNGDQPKAEEPAQYRPKLPLGRRRGAPEASAAPKLPGSFMNRWDANMDQLARDMDEYALQHIAQDLEKIKERDAAATASTAASAQRKQSAPPTSDTVRSPQAPKFKPHAPAKRYAERHPESRAATHQHRDHAGDVEIGDDGSDTDGDGDYIIDTYVRVAADSVGSDVAPEKMGLLVLDNDPDVDFFYGEESESEEEFEDEDDENAENYYTADYPDEEVASDDEFGRNPYLFRTGNASDLEEFDDEEDDGAEDAHSDFEDDGGRFKVTIGRQPLPRF